MNRLATSTSPYLRQHQDNPVDWWEWSEEALAEARRRDVPILLSVGYAACHWCHVMAHDSFEHDEVAEVMNAHFVNIKVDREERPDIDAVYMGATVALTGQGGWPMTCLLTPDGSPFFAGTFLPRSQFLQLLRSAAATWRERRDDVVASGTQIVSAIAEAAAERPAGAPRPPAGEDLAAAATRLSTQFDAVYGGFGGAPKFPPSMVLEFLLRHEERTGDSRAAAVSGRTFEAMARGGLYDQLAGGFARYSVDRQWVVPHFEKMLYDNALLLKGYLHWWRRTGDPLAERIARETAEFLLRDLGTPEGGFASALDADTDGEEGLTYVWTPTQLASVLGPADAAWAGELLAVTERGTFEHGASTLQLPSDPADPDRWADVRARLLGARGERAQPARDDKVVTAWNGLAIGALAEAGRLLAQPRYLDAATRCAELLVRHHLVDGRLRRASRDGRVGSALAILEDYGDLADGLMMLHQAGGEPRWRDAAAELLEFALAQFPDGSGGFFDTADDAETLVSRPKDDGDNATPSGSSALATALLGYAALTGSLEHRQRAKAAIAAATPLALAQPRFAGWWLAAAEAALAGPVEIAICGPDEAARAALTAAAWRYRPGGAVIVSGRPDEPGQPLLADRPVVGGRPAAYVCRGFVCDRPVTTVEELIARLAEK